MKEANATEKFNASTNDVTSLHLAVPCIPKPNDEFSMACATVYAKLG